VGAVCTFRRRSAPRTPTGVSMKRIAFALALVAMASVACKKADQRGMSAADSTAMADSMKMMSDSMHQMADSMKMMDTAKHRP
jgi:hypothetical protein